MASIGTINVIWSKLSPTTTTALWSTSKAHGTYLQRWIEDNMPPAAIPAGEMGPCTLLFG